jgi:transposase
MSLTILELKEEAQKQMFRWRPDRKATVVKAVLDGTISKDDAKNHFRLSGEELCSWIRRYQDHGVAGLRETRLRLYVPLEPSGRR